MHPLRESQPELSQLSNLVKEVKFGLNKLFCENICSFLIFFQWVLRVNCVLCVAMKLSSLPGKKSADTVVMLENTTKTRGNIASTSYTHYLLLAKKYYFVAYTVHSKSPPSQKNKEQTKILYYDQHNVIQRQHRVARSTCSGRNVCCRSFVYFSAILENFNK